MIPSRSSRGSSAAANEECTIAADSAAVVAVVNDRRETAGERVRSMGIARLLSRPDRLLHTGAQRRRRDHTLRGRAVSETAESNDAAIGREIFA
jgi:hypothetical protein